jgi:hypothetical protein
LASALAFWMPWAIAGVLVGALMFCAWYGPSQDVSNLSRWAWLAGWRNSPAWLRERSADRWTLRGGVTVAVLLVAIGGLRLFWRAEPAADLPSMPEIVRPPIAPPPPPSKPPAASPQPDRQLDSELENAIRVHAPKSKSVKLVVLAGDAEAARFADQIEAFVKAEGYGIAPRTSFLGGEPFAGARLFPDANDPNVFVIQVGPNDRK